VTVDDVNRLDREAFVQRVGFVYERSPWIADAAWPDRPWASVDELAASLRRVVDAARVEQQEDLLRAHPDLAGRELDEGRLTRSSQSEQKSVGLDALDPERRARLRDLASQYKAKFGFPCIICVREAGSADAILSTTVRRLDSTLEAERQTAIGEVHKIARLRLRDLLGS
jgi:2-oxo-4-hydroxy-4-carboxy-5-ureidoimidazoline decarboxylase